MVVVEGQGQGEGEGEAAVEAVEEVVEAAGRARLTCALRWPPAPLRSAACWRG